MILFFFKYIQLHSERKKTIPELSVPLYLSIVDFIRLLCPRYTTRVSLSIPNFPISITIFRISAISNVQIWNHSDCGSILTNLSLKFSFFQRIRKQNVCPIDIAQSFPPNLAKRKTRCDYFMDLCLAAKYSSQLFTYYDDFLLDLIIVTIPENMTLQKYIHPFRNSKL